MFLSTLGAPMPQPTPSTTLAGTPVCSPTNSWLPPAIQAPSPPTAPTPLQPSQPQIFHMATAPGAAQAALQAALQQQLPMGINSFEVSSSTATSLIGTPVGPATI